MTADGGGDPLASAAPAGPGTRRRRRRALAGLAACALVVAGLLAALAAAGPLARSAGTTGHAGSSTTTMPMVFPDGVLDLATVSEAVAAEYRFAAAHADAYDGLRCWCGCEAAFRHRSLTDCFLRPDGAWEAHGSGCGVCIAEATVARQRLDAGVAVADIRAELDQRFGPPPTT